MRILELALFATFSLVVSCFQPAFEQPRRQATQLSVAADQEDLEAAESTLSRRVLFQGAASALTVLGNPFESRANAAPPITAVEADSFTAKAQRLLRPKPPKALRNKLNKDFAVLLMRSSYIALDKLDCVAMVRTSAFVLT